MTVRDLQRALDVRFPFSRAENWDKIGLQIGDGAAEVRRVLVAYEVTDTVLDSAEGYDAIVAYHPLIFRSLENLDFRSHTARLAGRCLQQNLHLIVAHTALDNALPPHALGDALAAGLGLQETGVLQPGGYEALTKIVVFVPPEALEKVSAALWLAGAGHIGQYDRCSFRARGEGTFRAGAGANPYAGKIGELETADEWRLETIVPDAQRDTVIQAMIAEHPYEEVAYDLYPLHNRIRPYGSARQGVLGVEISLDEWAGRVQQKLNAPNLRVVRGKNRVLRVACAPGSGASAIEAAVRAGCDCLVTGDIKHHDALQAKALGLSVIDVTHAATERATIELLASALSTLDGLAVERCAINTNPFAAGG